MSFSNQLRQSSLVQAAGPGSLVVLKDGSTVLMPGVDAWYLTRGQYRRQDIPNSAILNDHLLSANLNVSHFVCPPAEGIDDDDFSDYVNASLFPRWVTCHSCKLLKQMAPGAVQREKCPNCSESGKYAKKMVQMNFVVACENGHLDDFPWIEWAHSNNPAGVCANPRLKFKASGIVELRSQAVECDCGQRRSLEGTTSGLMVSGSAVECNGALPWMSKFSDSTCSQKLVLVLRSASNIYFPSTVSSILVPVAGETSSSLRKLMSESNFASNYPAYLIQQQFNYELVAGVILVNEKNYYEGYSIQDLAQALKERFEEVPAEFALSEENAPFDRSPEWEALRQEQEDIDLVVRKVGYIPDTLAEVAQVLAVPLLKKTSALKGFSRVQPQNVSPGTGRQLLRRNAFASNSNWLPAVRHVGEGIFIEFDLSRLVEWESNSNVQNRVRIIESNLNRNQKEIPNATLSARFVLLHTLSHVIIQELVIECGYTSAALGERIYSAGDQSGLLIYTASSTADGTMGGLVEMAQPGRIVPVLRAAIERASWCSNDPICMELGTQGQGNFSSNLAACHSCCLLPETACEHFNQGLDRGLLVGDLTGTHSMLRFFDF